MNGSLLLRVVYLLLMLIAVVDALSAATVMESFRPIRTFGGGSMFGVCLLLLVEEVYGDDHAR